MTTSAIGPRLAALYTSGRQVPLNQLEGEFQGYSSAEASVAYAESLAAVEYIRATYGMGDLARLLRRLEKGRVWSQRCAALYMPVMPNLKPRSQTISRRITAARRAVYCPVTRNSIFTPLSSFTVRCVEMIV